MLSLETSQNGIKWSHPDTLASMVNLAYTWKSQGRDEEAFALMNQAERGLNEVLGSDHPYTVASLQTLKEWLA
jgi:hypothetical protein